MAMKAIIFMGDTLDAIGAHALRDYPHECCGALLGTGGDERRAVAAIIPIDNASDDDRRRLFSVSPRDYLRAEREAEARGLLLLGFYHSHPDHPARPSETDRRYAQPGFSYPIITVTAGGAGPIRSWRIDAPEGEYEEEEIITEERSQYDISTT
jgi:proteasome lid subunit RPN8/RPN11